MQQITRFHNIDWVELNQLLQRMIDEGKYIVSFCYDKGESSSEVKDGKLVITGFSYDGIVIYEEAGIMEA